MLKKGSKVRLSFVKPQQGAKGKFTKCSMSIPKKGPAGWEYENYSGIILGDYDLKDGDKFIVGDFGVSQNKKGDKTYYNVMIFDGEIFVEEKEEINDEEIPF